MLLKTQIISEKPGIWKLIDSAEVMEGEKQGGHKNIWMGGYVDPIHVDVI